MLKKKSAQTMKKVLDLSYFPIKRLLKLEILYSVVNLKAGLRNEVGMDSSNYTFVKYVARNTLGVTILKFTFGRTLVKSRTNVSCVTNNLLRVVQLECIKFVIITNLNLVQESFSLD